MATGGKKKKSAAPKKGASKTGKAAAKGRNAPSSSSSRFGGPLGILIIMGLLAVITIMAGSIVRDRMTAPKKAPIADEDVAQVDDRGESPDTDEGDVPDDSPGTIALDESNAPSPDEGTGTSTVTREVKIYLLRFDEKSEKVNLAAVSRRIDAAQPVEGALRELIKGPSAQEKKKGYLSAVPRELRLRGISMNGRTAVVDFNGAIEQNAAGSILMSRIDQIVYTATQFPEVTAVMIRVNGAQRNTLGGDGLAIGGPLRRRAP